MYAALSALPTHLKCHVFQINKKHQFILNRTHMASIISSNDLHPIESLVPLAMVAGLLHHIFLKNEL